MRIESWIRKATNTNTKFLIFIALHCNNTSSYTECYIIITLRLLLYINPVNKELIRIPPFPSAITCNATTSFRSSIHKYIFIYIIVIICLQCRSPEHTGHTIQIRTFFINTRHTMFCWDQRCKESHV